MSGKKGRSGRRPKREAFGALYESTARELHGLLVEVPEALRQLVVGVWREETNIRDGWTRIYQLPPNVRALELLLNRTIGAITQRVDVSGELDVRHFDLSGFEPEERRRLYELALEHGRGDPDAT